MVSPLHALYDIRKSTLMDMRLLQRLRDIENGRVRHVKIIQPLKPVLGVVSAHSILDDALKLMPVLKPLFILAKARIGRQFRLVER